MKREQAGDLNRNPNASVGQANRCVERLPSPKEGHLKPTARDKITNPKTTLSKQAVLGHFS